MRLLRRIVLVTYDELEYIKKWNRSFCPRIRQLSIDMKAGAPKAINVEDEFKEIQRLLNNLADKIDLEVRELNVDE